MIIPGRSNFSARWICSSLKTARERQPSRWARFTYRSLAWSCNQRLLLLLRFMARSRILFVTEGEDLVCARARRRPTLDDITLVLADECASDRRSDRHEPAA